jgi:hypothetical protein
VGSRAFQPVPNPTGREIERHDFFDSAQENNPSSEVWLLQIAYDFLGGVLGAIHHGLRKQNAADHDGAEFQSFPLSEQSPGSPRRQRKQHN